MKTIKTEAQLLKYAKERCQQAGQLLFKFASPAHRGVPDCVVICSRLVYFIEFKSPTRNGKLSPLQKSTIRKMKAAGALVFIVDNPEVLNEILKLVTTNPEKCHDFYASTETEELYRLYS